MVQNIGRPGGRLGMTGDQVFRVLMLKQMNDFSLDDIQTGGNGSQGERVEAQASPILTLSRFSCHPFE